MAFEGLSERLENSFKKLRAKGKLTEADVKDAMREVRLALLEADVNYKVAKDFTKSVTERAIGEDVMESLTPGQMVIKIVNEELTKLMGSTESRLACANHPPTVVMMCGLQGSGKTTHSAKLALKLKNEGHRPMLVACDIYRPAAIKQLQVVGEQVGVPVFERGTQNPVDTALEALSYAKDHGHDYVFLDTAGRLHIDEALMQELQNIKSTVHPHEILLVIDAMTGQDAVNVAKSFNETLGIDGVILTKLDGDTRGGAALSVRAVTGKPILYVGMGEKLSDLEQFYPERMASRILGMGDVLSLIEKAEQTINEEDALRMTEKMKKAEFDFNDFLDQMDQMKKMGGLSNLLSMIPGIGNKMQGLDIDDGMMDKTAAIIYSMTKEERANPKIINASRKRRIAAGAGVPIAEVNRLCKQVQNQKQMMKQMSGMFGGKGGKRGGFKLPF